MQKTISITGSQIPNVTNGQTLENGFRGKIPSVEAKNGKLGLEYYRNTLELYHKREKIMESAPSWLIGGAIQEGINDIRYYKDVVDAFLDAGKRMLITHYLKDIFEKRGLFEKTKNKKGMKRINNFLTKTIKKLELPEIPKNTEFVVPTS
jgi:hypothetical protein